MGYRNGTYIAFTGCGTTDPTKSDRKYFELIKAWKDNKGIDFSFINSHEKTYAVRDSSAKLTLLLRLNERFKESKNFLMIVTPKTKANFSEIFEYEVERAKELKLPFLIIYPGIECIKNKNEVSHLWPNILKKYIENDELQALHMPFKRHLLCDAIERFTLHSKESLEGSFNYYEEEFQKGN